jgi:hypothetical protein
VGVGRRRLRLHSRWLPCSAASLPPTVCRAPHAGKKRLLRKCEYRSLPTRVTTLAVSGSRVYAGDGQESLVFLRWVVWGRVRR